MRFLKLLPSALLAFAPELIGASFASSCYNIAIDANYLLATCYTDSGSTYPQAIDLNACIGNDDGTLVWESG